MKKILAICFIATLISCKQDKNERTKNIPQQSDYETIGNIERLSSKLDNLIDTDAQIEILTSGYLWSEGPLWLEDQQMLIWSDVPQNTIYGWKDGEEAKLFLKPSGFTGQNPSSSTEEGSNGLLLDNNDNLILCQHGDRRVAKMTAPLDMPGPEFSTLIDNYQGKKLNSPNDAAYDADGNLYFTDPPYGLKGIDQSKEKELNFNGVYKLDTQGKLTMLVDSLTKPNGIAFNPDFTKCYVANSDPEKAFWAVYDITPEKTFSNGKLFFDATSMVASKKGLPDGLKVDNSGNVFATGPGGVLVFSPQGEHLGTIATEQATANCAFNQDKSMLFMTAHSYILRLSLKTN
ncbi:MAG: SMP-30/gluconolactonase/LRE family protein [Flavobacteriaceae bacterium]|nr:SMP-30/gluconolactonase/LRE family protein [Flavobacteriaceae bacterium]